MSDASPLPPQIAHTFPTRSLSVLPLTESHSISTLTHSPPFAILYFLALRLLFYISLFSNDILFVPDFPAGCTWLESRDVSFSDVADKMLIHFISL